MSSAATNTDSIFTFSACLRTCRKAASSSIFSSPASMLRAPRPARPTQVFSSAWKIPSAPIEKGTNRPSRQSELACMARSRAAKLTVYSETVDDRVEIDLEGHLALVGEASHWSNYNIGVGVRS